MLAVYLYLTLADAPTVTEVCEAMGMPKLRLIPIINMMEDRGVVSRDPRHRDRLLPEMGRRDSIA